MHRSALGALFLVACGLEQDWQRWDQLSQSDTTAAGTSSGDTSGSPGDASSSGPTPGDTTNSETSTGPADTSTTPADTSTDGSTSAPDSLYLSIQPAPQIRRTSPPAAPRPATAS